MAVGHRLEPIPPAQAHGGCPRAGPAGQAVEVQACLGRLRGGAGDGGEDLLPACFRPVHAPCPVRPRVPEVPARPTSRPRAGRGWRPCRSSRCPPSQGGAAGCDREDIAGCPPAGSHPRHVSNRQKRRYQVASDPGMHPGYVVLSDSQCCDDKIYPGLGLTAELAAWWQHNQACDAEVITVWGGYRPGHPHRHAAADAPRPRHALPTRPGMKAGLTPGRPVTPTCPESPAGAVPDH